MKIIDDAVFIEASDLHAVKTVFYAQLVLKKVGRVLFGAAVQGALLFFGAVVALKVYMALMF